MKLILPLLTLFVSSTTLAQTAEEYYNYGVTNGEKGNYKEAIKDFKKLLR